MGSPASREPYRPGRPNEPNQGTDSDFAIDHGYFSSSPAPPAPSAAPEKPAGNVPSSAPPLAPARDFELGNHYEVQPSRPETKPAAEAKPPVAKAAAHRVPEPEAAPVYEFMDAPEPKESARKKDRPKAIIYKPPVVEREIETPRTQKIVERVLRDWRLQVAVLVTLLATSWWGWHTTRNAGFTSIRTIRRHPRDYDGRQVKVRGRIDDVFPVGESYAFNLLSGRDTLVVFTRSRVPVTRQKVVVAGEVSIGYLEGVPRSALFETTN